MYSSKRTTLDTNDDGGDRFIESGAISDTLNTYANYEYGPLGTGGGTVMPEKNFVIKLCDLAPMSSFFTINRNIYSSSVLYLRLETNEISKFGFNLSTAALDDMYSIGATNTFPITKLSLNIYCEANNDLINIARQ